MGPPINVFSNPWLLPNIHKSVRSTKIHCNAGVVQVAHMGTFPRYGLVWFNGELISNILSMSNSTNKFPVYYDIKDGNSFIIQKSNDQLVFSRIPSGLYFHDFGDRNIFMVATITVNRDRYTDQEFAAAKEARGGLTVVVKSSPMYYIIWYVLVC